MRLSATNSLQAFVLVACVVYLASILPIDVLTADTPATGGDTASHFWPLQTLMEHGFFSGNLRVWNPGNLLGEPHLVHYFPLPFMIMGLMGLILPLHVAFNVGTCLPIIVLPLSVYYFARETRLPSVTKILLPAFSLIALSIDTYSAWGGNIASTFAGQFCHLYAVNFLLLAFGRMATELKANKPPLGSGALLAAVCLSHAYILLCVPPLALLMVFVINPSAAMNGKDRAKFLGLAAGIAFSLSIWWLWPSIDNAKWTTPYADRWLNWIKSDAYFPVVLYPLVIAILMTSPLALAVWKAPRWLAGLAWKSALFPLVLMAFYGAMVFVFPLVGLVDIRALPQVHLGVCMLGAVLVGSWLMGFREKVRIPMALVLVVAVGAMLYPTRYKMTSWAKWNYSGWSAKDPYKDLTYLSQAMRGTFSMSRVIFEQNDTVNAKSGSSRVFEMLPYFMHRATLESLYMQATIVAPQVFALQALISPKPSCPLKDWECAKFDMNAAIPRLRLFGVGDLIMSSDQALSAATSDPRLVRKVTEGSWVQMQMRDPVSQVLFPKVTPRMISAEDWRHRFHRWFLKYDENEPLLLVDRTMTEEQRFSLLRRDPAWSRQTPCNAETVVDVNRLELKTDCPGVFHVLKFAYHDALLPTNGDKTILTSPGFVGIVPSSNHVTFTFGQKLSWRLSAWISLLGVIGWLVAVVRRRKGKT